MLTSLAFLQQGNVEKSDKLSKMVNIAIENLHIFWTSWGISTKFTGKMSLKIILKVKRNQNSTLSLKNTFVEKLQEESNWPPIHFSVKSSNESFSVLGLTLCVPCSLSAFICFYPCSSIVSVCFSKAFTCGENVSLACKLLSFCFDLRVIILTCKRFIFINFSR